MKAREIKFRVWYGETMQYSDYRGESINELNVADLFQTYCNGVFMQYTGLKDKNGKEIYEGDIYQVALNKKYEVRYLNGESNHEWYGGCFGLYQDDELFFPFDDFAIKNGCVLGNIYEHPELLPKTN